MKTGLIPDLIHRFKKVVVTPTAIALGLASRAALPVQEESVRTTAIHRTENKNTTSITEAHSSQERVHRIQDLVKNGKASNVFEKYQEAKIDLQSHITKNGLIVNFADHLIIEEGKKLVNTLMIPFQNMLTTLSQEEEPNSPAFIELYKVFYLDVHKLILDVNSAILEKTCKLSHANDADLAKALVTCKQVSKAIAAQALEAIRDSYQRVPSVPIYDQNNESKPLLELIRDASLVQTRSLYLAREFGMHDQKIINSFIGNGFKIDDTSDSKLHRDLIDTLLRFQDATEGSVVVPEENNTPQNISIQRLDETTIKQIIDRLIANSVARFEAKYGGSISEYTKEQLTRLKFMEEELARFIQNSHTISSNVVAQARALGSDPKLKSLGLDEETEAHSCGDLFHTNIPQLSNGYVSALMGTLSRQATLGHNIPDTQIASWVAKSEHREKQFTRTILETSLLAALDAFMTARENREWRSCRTIEFDSIPWLQDLYDERRKHYEKMVKENTNSDVQTAPLMAEISRLGNALHDIGLFTMHDFCARYGAPELETQVLDQICSNTDVGIAALTIDLFINLFSELSNANPQDFEPGMVDRIRETLRNLKRFMTIYDEQRNELIAPKRPNEIAKKAYNKVHEIIADSAELKLAGEPIIHFVKYSLGLLSNGMEPNPKYVNLACLMFYFLIKFLPEHSKDIDSLRIKIEALSVLLNDGLQQHLSVPPPLYTKWRNAKLGKTEANKDNSDQGARQGVIKAFCDDLDSQIQEYIKGKTTGISLEDLLSSYYQVEQIFKQNPKAKTKYEGRLNAMHNTPGRPLLRGLGNVLKDILRINPELVMNFTRDSKDPELKEIVKQALLQEIGKSYQVINPGRTLVIEDDNEAQIKSLISLLQKTINLGELTKDTQNFSDDSELTEGSFKPYPNLGKDFDNLESLLNLEVILVERNVYSSREAFPDQYIAKMQLIALIKNFKSMRLKKTTDNNPTIQQSMKAIQHTNPRRTGQYSNSVTIQSKF